MSKSKAESQKLKELEKQIAELTDALQRERADVMNVRRQHEEQIARLKELVKTDVIKELLPVIDNFERALKHVPKELQTNDYIRGVQGIVKQFEKSLEQMGVQRIKTVREIFNPTYHEAVAMEDGDGTVERVSEELQAGYTLGEEVIRHAMVRVKLANE